MISKDFDTEQEKAFLIFAVLTVMICGVCIWHMMDTHLTACETTRLLLSMYKPLYA